MDSTINLLMQAKLTLQTPYLSLYPAASVCHHAVVRTRRHFQTTEQAARRRIPAWIEEAIEGVSASDAIRALAYWRAQTKARDGKIRSGCSWCNSVPLGRLCLACQKRDDAGWVRRVRANRVEVVPPIQNLAERLERVEATLYLSDGVGRVETGPFSATSIIDSLDTKPRDEN